MISFLLIIVVLVIFKAWFSLGLMTSGDLSFFYPETVKAFLNFPLAWETFREAGLGGISFLHLGVYFYTFPMGFLGQFLDYGLMERLVWFWPILIVGIISPFFLAKELNLFPSRFYPLASLIFFLNTYFLMIMGGGQLTVVSAYIMMPLVLTLFLKAFRETNFKKIIFFSLALAFLIAWDFRFAYLFGIILGFYLFYFFGETLKNAGKYFKVFLVVGLFILGFHAFWLLPFLLNYQNPVASLASAYTTSEAVRFFSFADFSHSLSLLQPNWPENIFGKTYFMQWQFLILPILAYSSLLFINSKLKMQKSKLQFNNGSTILFFALLGLIGAFLAKGSNPPFGEIYLWLFNYIPGMVMFRDPTKFYTLIALSYSILIPYSLWKIYEWLSSRFKNYFPNLFLILATLCLILLIKPAWMGELGGTFKSKEVPKEYLELKNFIADQPEFFRTFWVPTQQRFTFYTDNHPATSGKEFFKVDNVSAVMEKLKNQETEKQLSLSGVKYVILPDDTEGEIFLKDRQYDDQQRQVIEKELDKIPWLKKIQFSDFNNPTKTIFYKTSGFSDRFWLESGIENTKVYWQMINPTKYKVSVKNLQKPVTLVFSENYNSQWAVEINGQKIYSQKVHDRFNSFLLSKGTNGEIVIEFIPQKYVYLGLIIGLITIVSSIGLLIWKK